MLDTLEQSALNTASDAPRQQTVAGPVKLAGKGLLLGEHANVTILPAPPDHGIVFERIDQNPSVFIPARVENVTKRARRTTLRKGTVSIETVEHCLSAMAGLRIDNALIQIDGPELPCGDGSAAPFVDPIMEVGVVEQDAPRRIYRVTEPILVEEDGAMLAAFPVEGTAGRTVAGSSTTVDADSGFQVVFDLDYGPKVNRIRRQTQAFAMNNGDYRHEIAPARTYSLKEEAQALWDRGMCRHLTPRDVLVIGEDGPIDNAYRFENEPVRHKVLDLLGDLYLVGCEVQARFIAHRSGHELNRRMAVRIVEQMRSAQRQHSVRAGRELDIRTIQRVLPHRYPMLLVDRVVAVEGDRKAIGIKNVTINEPFFQGHYPGTPIMPGVLLVEAMAQLGGLLMSQKLEHTGKIAVLLSLDRVKLRRPVVPGDQVVLEAEALQAKPRTGTVRCKAFVTDKLAAEAQIRFMMVDAEQE